MPQAAVLAKYIMISIDHVGRGSIMASDHGCKCIRFQQVVMVEKSNPAPSGHC
ncbi:acetyltransferase [Xanthomonas phaseoli pv. manihotis]|nr:acetyltransferase [Xanthomonas phaseoli pv. manihotis]